MTIIINDFSLSFTKMLEPMRVQFSSLAASLRNQLRITGREK